MPVVETWAKRGCFRGLGFPAGLSGPLPLAVLSPRPLLRGCRSYIAP